MFGKPPLNNVSSSTHAQLQKSRAVRLAGCFANMYRLPNFYTGCRAHRVLTPSKHAEGSVLSFSEETKEGARVRAAVVDALQSSREMIEPFLTSPWDDYCRAMRMSGTWGGAGFKFPLP